MMEKDLWSNNKMIHQFRFGIDEHIPLLMRYHSDWNWLMPVIEKILNEHQSCALLEGKGYTYEGNGFDMLLDESNGVHTSNTNTLIEAVYLSVVAYIKQINNKQ